MEPESQIVKFYTGKSIFITGATGYLGKGLVEKLLRSCAGLNKIYVLVRHKKGVSPQIRIDEEIFNCPVCKYKLFL